MNDVYHKLIYFIYDLNMYYYNNRILFFIRHFTERGTEVATYDYAKYNEDILHNKSYIICFTNEGQKTHFSGAMERYDKFKRFEIMAVIL